MVEVENVALPDAVRKQMDAAKVAQAAYVAEGEIVDIVEDSPPQTQIRAQEQEPTVPDQPQAPKTVDGEDWKHKYDVLKGKFDRLAADNESLLETLQRANSTNDNLNNLIVSMQSNVHAQVPENQETDDVIVNDKPGGNGRLNAEDFEGYGDEMVTMVSLVNKLVDQNNQLKSQLGNVEGRVENVRGRVEQTAQSSFFTEMDSLIGKWKDINTDKRFLDWLKLPDDITGQIRNDILQGHFERSDAEMVANVFRAGATAIGIPIQADQGQAPPPQQSTQQTRSGQLAGQIIPDSAGNENPADLISPTPKMITREQYHQASQDVTTGRMSQEDFAALTRQFQKLISEGKVT